MKKITSVFFLFFPLILFMACADVKLRDADKNGLSSNIVDETHDGHLYSFFREGTSDMEKQIEVKLPMILLYTENPHVRHSTPLPKLHLAVWDDGIIVWSVFKTTKDTEMNVEKETTYFKSHITSEIIDKLFCDIYHTELWNYNGENVFPPSSHICKLFLQDENICQSLRITVWDVDWPNPPFNNIHDIRHKEIANSWKQTIVLLKDIVPQNGDVVRIEFRKEEMEGFVYGIQIPVIFATESTMQ